MTKHSAFSADPAATIINKKTAAFIRDQAIDVVDRSHVRISVSRDLIAETVAVIENIKSNTTFSND